MKIELNYKENKNKSNTSNKGKIQITQKYKK